MVGWLGELWDEDGRLAGRAVSCGRGTKMVGWLGVLEIKEKRKTVTCTDDMVGPDEDLSGVVCHQGCVCRVQMTRCVLTKTSARWSVMRAVCVVCRWHDGS